MANARLVAVQRPTEAATAFVVEILRRRACLGSAAARARSCVPVFSRRASLRAALALAELVVPVLVGGAAFGLNARADACLSVKEEALGAVLEFPLAIAVTEVEVLVKATLLRRAHPDAQFGVPLRVWRLFAAWQAMAFAMGVVPVTVDHLSELVLDGLARLGHTLAATARLVPGHGAWAYLGHALAGAPLRVPFEKFRACLGQADAAAHVHVEVISAIALGRWTQAGAGCLAPE